MKRSYLLWLAATLVAALLVGSLAGLLAYRGGGSVSEPSEETSLGGSWDAAAAPTALEVTPSPELTGLAEPGPGLSPSPTLSPMDVDAVMAHIEALANGIGTRVAGTDGERRGADYIAGELADFGYTTRRQTFPLPDGATSQNVVATLPGSSDEVFVVGAHFDTKGPSPGANDNGTGVAITLELARVLRDVGTVPSARGTTWRRSLPRSWNASPA